MKILGIDPGYDRVGIGIVERINNVERYIYSECIETDKKQNFVDRLIQIENRIVEIIHIYKPELTVIEDIFFAKNAKTAIKVAQARGAILITCRRSIDNKILELTPMQIKSSLVGDGHADKSQVEYMVRQILHLNQTLLIKNNKQKLGKDKQKTVLDDEIDALSIALAGAQYYNSY